MPARPALAAAGAALCLLAASRAAETSPRFLRADGRTLRDAPGAEVRLRGANLGGWLLFEPWMCPMDASGLKDDWTARDLLEIRFGRAGRDRLLKVYEDNWITTHDLDLMAALGFNCVRLPFWYRTLQEEDGTWRPDAFARLDWCLTEAGKRGIYTILDLHGVPGGQVDAEGCGRIRKKEVNGLTPDFWTNEANLKRTEEIWTKVAERYRGRWEVAAYDLVNEPIGAPSREVLWSVYDRLYRAVRRADAGHIITVEGCWSGQTKEGWVGWGWKVLPEPSRQGWTNVLYQMHNYEWDWNSLDKQKASADRQVREWREFQKWGVPCLMGEFNPMAHEAAWSHALNAYEGSGMSWTIWTWKATHGTGSDSWGIHNPRKPMPPKPDLARDSEETIARKWAAWSTRESFAPNPMVEKVLKEARPSWK